ncbi:MAG: M20/M25/M40 family metallo-hydrolase [Proteobacteria bacterium]|nr:M20/M25/M40 family metallo-hydrolase [Pseudomonadota bacterium]
MGAILLHRRPSEVIVKRIKGLLNCLILPAIFAAPAFSQPPEDRGAFLSLYRELVETNTTYSSGDCTRAARQLEARFRAAGFTDSELTQYVPPDRPRDGGLVVTWNGRNPSIPAMLLLAHIDVVEAKREDWVRDPFKLIEEEGYFYGRGTTDDKAQAAIFTDTLIRLREAKFQPKRTLKLALTCGEETSNPDVLNGAGWLVDNRPDLLKAAFALNEGGSGRGGPTGMPSYLGLGVGEKSPRNFAIEATNPGGHSSTPVRDNAIYQLAEGLVRLRDLQFPVRLNPVTRVYFEKMSALHPDALGAAMKAIAADPNNKSAEAIVSADRAYNAMLRTTCVATLLTAGHAINALPQRATASVNCRIIPGETPEEVRATLERTVAGLGLKVTRMAMKERTLVTPPPLDPKIVGPMEKIAAKHFPGVPIIPDMSTGASDATHLGRIGIPTYGVPGLWNEPETAGTHGLNERISVNALYRGRDYLFELIEYFAAGS